MQKAQDILTRQYQEMRWRILSLAADMDRLQRADAGEKLLKESEQIEAFRACIREILSADSGRAERIQMILSDKTPPPSRK